MFRSLVARPLAAACPARQARLYSQPAVSLDSSPQPTPSANKLPYLVRRNSKGSIPVYTDIRNGGTKYFVLIRNVEGNPHALAEDLSRTLFPTGTNEAERMRVHIVRQRHIVLSGGHWKNDVIRWLAQKGF